MEHAATRPRSGVSVLPAKGFADLDATYLKARWAGTGRGVALLVAGGVSDEGLREVLAVEVAAGERSEAYRGLLQTRGLRGVKLVLSDDHDSITTVDRSAAR